MFETAQKYSDGQYCRKSDVAHDFKYVMIDPIWDEIEAYRKLFRWSIPFSKEYYITRNSYINDRMNEVSELLYQVCYENQQEHIIWKSDTRILSAQQEIATTQFIQQMELGAVGDLQNALFHFLNQCNLHTSINKLHTTILLDNHISILIRIFIAMEFFDKATYYALSVFLLGTHKMLYPLTFFPFSDCFDDNIKATTEYDLTYKFLQFINKSQLYLSKQVLSLGWNAREDVRTLSKQELRERYPMLNKHQIHFFLSHNQWNHFYTIQDYMTYTKVCYETARYSLEGLVKQNWYQKKLIGKKFMYYVI